MERVALPLILPGNEGSAILGTVLCGPPAKHVHRDLEGGPAWVPGVWGQKDVARSLGSSYFPLATERGGSGTWLPAVPLQL